MPKLTKAIIGHLKYEGVTGSTCIYWDDEIKGLGVRVFPSGQKTFVLSCFIEGKHRIKKLERYGRITLKEARDKAQDCFSALRHGMDPFDKKIIKENTFTVADLGKEYIDRYAKLALQAFFINALEKTTAIRKPQSIISRSAMVRVV